MPIPILIGIGAAIAGAVGVGKGIKAAVDNSNANDYNRWANQDIEEANKYILVRREACGQALMDLGEKKVFTLTNSIVQFLDSFEKLTNVDFTDSPGLDELKNFPIDRQSLKELRDVRWFRLFLGWWSGRRSSSWSFDSFWRLFRCYGFRGSFNWHGYRHFERSRCD
jgi:hypothetical protein